MKIKASELSGAALDLAVAKCLGQSAEWMADHKRGYVNSPSTDWSQGGPIIERERIYVYPHPDQATWLAVLKGAAFNAESATPLIAAMRCFVASKLGNEVEVPEELLG